MKNLSGLQCICGMTHKNVPKDASFAEVDGDPVVQWHCVCERKINIGAELVEFAEIMGMLEYSKFRCAMHTLRQRNLRARGERL